MRRHAVLQFFEPIERDVDLLRRNFARVCCGFTQHHHEVLVIGSDVIPSCASSAIDFYWQRCGFSKRKPGLSLNINGNDLPGSAGLIFQVEEMLAIMRPERIAATCSCDLILGPSERK